MYWQQQAQPLGSRTHLRPKFINSGRSPTSRNRVSIPSRSINCSQAISIPSNAHRRKKDPHWFGGFSLGVDLGSSRTGVALSRGFEFRPLPVLELKGQKLENRLLEIAVKEEVDEFIIGLPKSRDGNETVQSNKVRSVAGRLAVSAAHRGLRVYLMDEYGTSAEALDHMINIGLKSSARESKIDAYAAVAILQRYFSMSGQGTELVLPKQLDLQDKIRKGPPKDDDFFS